ncbi:hypothetical protein [Dysosmobacter sp.]|uniref:hypothetical protein n=1 Tax=Dysosmobacter sp. TaxID=2591382 RepID=UPI003AF51B84
MGQVVSLDETAKIKYLKKLRITKENHRNQVIPVIFGGDYWTRTSGLMRVNIQWCCFLWNFSGSIPVYHRISSLGYTLSSIASVPVFLFVGHGVGQNVMFS